MAPSVAQTALIFEDPRPEAAPPKSAKSSGGLFRGRKRDIDDDKTGPKSKYASKQSTSGPLEERHINSPPQSKKIPLKEEASSRPAAHRKTASATSFKGFWNRKSTDEENRPPLQQEPVELEKAKKLKSSTNLVGLLKKSRSKKDLTLEEPKQEAVVPAISPTKVRTPLWEQLATQPQMNLDGTMVYPSSPHKLPSCQTPPLTPQIYSEQHCVGADVNNYFDIDPALRMPQRPYLERKGSRSSIFTEEIDQESESTDTRPRSIDLRSNGLQVDRPQAVRQQSGQSSLCNQVEISQDKVEERGEEKRSRPRSKIFDMISTFNARSRHNAAKEELEKEVLPENIDFVFEQVLEKNDIPQNLREHMRNLKPEVKAGLVKGEQRIGSGSSSGTATVSTFKSDENDRPLSRGDNDDRRPRSRSRPRSGIFSISKRNRSKGDVNKVDQEESTRSRSKSRPKSQDISARPLSTISNMSTASIVSGVPNDSTSTPGDFIHYLTEVQKPELVDVGKIHKLRMLLRNQPVQWTDVFVRKGGMNEIVGLVHRIMRIEWREDHEDQLLHETLLCLKALSTTNLAMQKLENMERELLPALLRMLFDPERKGPAEFATRSLIIQLIFAHLSATLYGDADSHVRRTRAVIELMRDPKPENATQTVDFVSQMHTARPYRIWCKEVNNVTKEVFWIFLHHLNCVPIMTADGADERPDFARNWFPAARAPHPAAPYVGGVEWEATQYLAAHLDLLNGLIVSLPTRQERNALREELRNSGFEKVMGITLRTCKEKFYASVHDGLRNWVGAAKSDDWPVEDVRAGPPRDQGQTRNKSPAKKADAVPQLELDVGTKTGDQNGGWL